MIQANEVDSRAGSDSSVLADLIDQLTAKMQAGEAIDWEQVARQHPEHAGELLQFKPALGALGELSRSGAEDLSGLARPAAPADGLFSGTLGDFRIIGEVGRGGMGVVYEAEQVSLGRRVALKVLPFAATMDRRQLQRFHNEARAAAGLHHTNIVPVHAVGEERGVHYYAMQFIHGQTLAAMIADQRRQGDKAPLPNGEPTTPHVPGEPAPATVEQAASSTERSPRKPAYFRQVAEWGIQAAEALDYAHGVGIIHRDVKPANLLVDASGRLWVTDFGLAQVKSDARLTMTGDLVGTLRYMSPEQALAKRVIVDHRTDVYSLGATLYEMLTLQAAFEGGDRQELLRQIAFDEPRRPRQWNRAIPRELETIVLKAMERNPADRYATAQEMADDLQRFVEDKPIRARRPTVRQRLGRWGRRHPGWTAALGLAAGLLLAGAWALDREKTQAETKARTVVAEADQLREADRLPEALLAARRAADLLPRFGGDASLRRAIEECVADLQLVNRLEELRQEAFATRVVGQGFDQGRAALLFRQAFLDYGIDVIAGEEADIAQTLRGRAAAAEIVAALDAWGQVVLDPTVSERLNRLADALDADPRQLVSRVRRATQGKDVQALKRLAAEAEANQPLPTVLVRLGKALMEVALYTEGERLLRVGQQRYPGDFWINKLLGDILFRMGTVRAAESVRFMSAALALRPLSPLAWSNLGCAMHNAGRHEEAVAAFRRAIALKPDLADAHNNLGTTLHNGQKRYVEAEAAFRKAIALEPNNASTHRNLGNALLRQGRRAEAESAYRQAIEIKANYPDAYCSLGNALENLGKPAEAEKAYRKAIELNREYAEAHSDLGGFLSAQGKLAEAEVACRRAIELKPDLAAAYSNLGAVLFRQGKLAEAETALRKAIELKPDYFEAHGNLGAALLGQGKKTEGVTALRKAIELNPVDPDANMMLGDALNALVKVEEAEVFWRKAIDLKPDFAEAHCSLGGALMRKGQFKQALTSFRLGHQFGSHKSGWSYPSARWIREAEQMAQLDDRLPAVLDGKDKPKDTAECLGFASLCQMHRQRFAASAHFFEDAFAEQPALAGDLQAGHRYNAACAAALAGCGQGKDAADLAEKERARLRQQALDWLRADLDAWNGLLKKEPDKLRPVVIQQLQHWQADTDFAGVRAALSLAILPEAERPAWQKLWADVTETLGKAKGDAPGSK